MPKQHSVISISVFSVAFLFFFTLNYSLEAFNSQANADIIYSNCIFRPNIRTVRLNKVGIELSEPILPLKSNDQLNFEFDDLNGNVARYRYTFIHCDANWKPSDIWPNEYLLGDPEGYIDTHGFSFNTIQHYTHYSLIFPNDQVRFTLSGNYILKVFTRDARGNDDLVITRRFMVFDQKASVNIEVSRASLLNFMNEKQEVDFTVQNPGMMLTDPKRNVHVTVMQNGRWDNALTALQPFMQSSNLLDYRHDNGCNLFSGDNEFRHFDTKSLLHLSEKLKKIRRSDSGYVAELWEIPPRMFKPYSFEDDINGNFVIRNTDYGNESIQGEYVWVHFVLPFNSPSSLGDLYVLGNFNAWQFTPENKMSYNLSLKAYEGRIYLKQGYYDYLYALLPAGGSAGNTAFIDGNHYETGNNYSVLVYYREPGTLYDQLIGFNSKNSH